LLSISKKGDIAKGRSKVYSWLASFYLFEPTHELLKTLLEPNLLKALALIFNEQRARKALLTISYIPHGDVEAIKDDFYSLFVVPVRGIYVPPYESCFRERGGQEFGSLWGETTEDVLKFYHEAGFQVSYPRYVFAPDHIGLELAFMSELCSKEAEELENGNASKAMEVRRTQLTFLRSHVLSWIFDYVSKIESSHSRLYRQVALLTKSFIQKDHKILSLLAQEAHQK
jgi:TorA maturation chaperone TorD